MKHSYKRNGIWKKRTYLTFKYTYTSRILFRKFFEKDQVSCYKTEFLISCLAFLFYEKRLIIKCNLLRTSALCSLCPLSDITCYYILGKIGYLQNQVHHREYHNLLSLTWLNVKSICPYRALFFFLSVK